MRARRLFPVLALLLLASPAVAQTRGFALDRFDPAERGSDWFSVESLDLRGHRRTTVGATLDWAHEPLVVFGPNDEEVAAIVEDQLFLHFGAGFVLGERLEIGLSLPLALLVTGEEAPAGFETYGAAHGANVGDLRLNAQLRILGQYGAPLVLAGGVQLFLPTGDRDSFTGDGMLRVVPRVLVAGDIGPFAYGARAGVNIRGQTENFAGAPFGSEVQVGAAAGLRLFDRKLLVGPELWTSTVVSDSGRGVFERLTTPLEVILGAHLQASPSWRTGVGAGTGLTRGLGSPEVRVVASIDWTSPLEGPKPLPPPPPRDTDSDGVPDSADQCPNDPGVIDLEGCMPPPDRDLDRVPDAEDQCPDEPGPADTKGCLLPPDRDQDGVPDSKDDCPDQPGQIELRGCAAPPAPLDTDTDTIPDDKDACPLKAGPADPDPARNGCPQAEVSGEQIVILGQVLFETNRAVIRPESEPVLQAVLAVLKQNPDLTKLDVQGHTDDRGGAPHNKYLSGQRAKAVVKWLIDHGIEAGRLTSAGYGQARPIAPNDTEEGRQKNRRVEFHIVERDGKPVEKTP